MGQADLLLDANAEPHAWGATGELGTDGRTGAPPAGAHGPPPATGASGLEARIQQQCVRDAHWDFGNFVFANMIAVHT